MLWCGSSQTTTYRVSHKISAAYAQGCETCFDEFSAGLPPLPRKLSAGFCTAGSGEFPHNLRTFSTRSAQVFDERLRRELHWLFPQRFQAKSAANSRRSRRKKRRKASGGRKCVEKRSELHTVCGTWNNFLGNSSISGACAATAEAATTALKSTICSLLRRRVRAGVDGAGDLHHFVVAGEARLGGDEAGCVLP